MEKNQIGEVIEYNETALNEAIDRLISIKNEWPRIGARAKKLYEEFYCWKKMEEKIIELYQNI